MWRGLTSSQRHARKIISDPSPTAKTRLLSCNRIQSRVVTGLLAGHHTVRRHIYIMGLIDSPLCWRCAAEEETPSHVLCEREALGTLRHTYLGSFLLDRDDIRSLSLRAIWNFIKGTGLTWLGHKFKGTKDLSKGLRASGQKGLEPIYYSILFYSIPF